MDDDCADQAEYIIFPFSLNSSEQCKQNASGGNTFNYTRCLSNNECKTRGRITKQQLPRRHFYFYQTTEHACSYRFFPPRPLLYIEAAVCNKQQNTLMLNAELLYVSKFQDGKTDSLLLCLFGCYFSTRKVSDTQACILMLNILPKDGVRFISFTYSIQFAKGCCKITSADLNFMHYYLLHPSYAKSRLELNAFERNDNNGKTADSHPNKLMVRQLDNVPEAFGKLLLLFQLINIITTNQCSKRKRKSFHTIFVFMRMQS